eukprot:5298905-Pyramimonas_sp.AAC.2
MDSSRMEDVMLMEFMSAPSSFSTSAPSRRLPAKQAPQALGKPLFSHSTAGNLVENGTFAEHSRNGS